jgi:excisionase family DNA binding protein
LDPNILPNQKTILDTEQLMESLNVTRPTVQKWRDSGRIPFIQVGNVVRYDLDAVLEALSKKKGGKKC